MTVVHRTAPGPIAAWRNLRFVLVLLAGLLAVLAFGTLAHAVVRSARSRSRELAVWRALGLCYCERRSTLLWQGTFRTAASLVVGVPLGVVAGSAAWARMRDGLGLASPLRALTPHVAITVAVAATAMIGLVAVIHTRDPGSVARVLQAE
jgi:ABC-type lipoprotein release transport system permease subunit